MTPNARKLRFDTPDRIDEDSPVMEVGREPGRGSPLELRWRRPATVDEQLEDLWDNVPV